MMLLLRLTFLALLSSQALAYSPDDFIHSLGATMWGYWGLTDACANGSYAYGFEISVEEEQGALDDDTSLNAIKLFCHTPDGMHTGEVTSSTFNRGSWTGAHICSSLITGYDIKVQPEERALDNTAANALRMYCDGGDYLEAPGNKWGDWLGPSHCRTGMAVCGLMTRVDEDQGTFGDDTALNDVRFLCCDLPAKE
ncbi:hypothetical protein Pcinc_027865 [Petrolisthes cinctipes]|uniref:Vitelline membrane outer layer protein 1 homolog n=1 Tax=Petrolisthes cinctipes TaxID=88211 RepID=A0AAE1F470_PETCI|nr:hypothetical protein Pcinc_027865 [Petrolisthes cinctipes]